MPRYRLYLHDGPTTPPESHFIEVLSDDDATDLARITLLTTQKFTHVEVWKNEALLGVEKRDSHHP